MEEINKYLLLINLKAFCGHYNLNYEFTRQVLQGKRPITEKFTAGLIENIKDHQIQQQEILKRIQTI